MIRRVACACGGFKDVKARMCLSCRIKLRRSARLEDRWFTPRECACGKSAELSPFHCFCKRWKSSSDEFCTTCVGHLRDAMLA